MGWWLCDGGIRVVMLFGRLETMVVDPVMMGL
jgi:hypothetical protein